MKRRRGFTLVEMLIAMSVGTIISAVAIALIVTLMRSENVAQDHIRKSAVESRLADRFRRDVHAAESIDIDDAGLAWTFTLGPEHAIAYRIDANHIERLETDASKIERRETFILPPDRTAAIETPRRPIVTLSIVQADASDDKRPGTPVRFDAVLAADLRYGEPVDLEDNEEDANGQ